MLHGADDINGNDDDDAENPLLRQRGIYNNNNNNNYVNVNLNKKSYWFLVVMNAVRWLFIDCGPLIIH